LLLFGCGVCYTDDSTNGMKFKTRMPIAECRSRLASATDLRGLALSWDAEGPGTVVGEFRGRAFRLHTKRYYDNAFAPFFYGTLIGLEDGTMLEGRFKMHPFIRLFTLFWFSILVVFAAGALMVPAQGHPAGGAGKGLFFAVLAGLAVLGVVLVAMGRWLARAERDVILSFLKNTLETTDA
jgi:hypothetical protein